MKTKYIEFATSYYYKNMKSIASSRENVEKKLMSHIRNLDVTENFW